MFSPSLGKDMYYVYVLKSEKDRKLYIGYTHDLQKRFKSHNDGAVTSTKLRVPLRLVYYEAYFAEEDARKREKMLKRFSGATTHLKRRIEASIILSK